MVWADTKQPIEEPIADLSDTCLIPGARLGLVTGSWSQLLMDAYGDLDQGSHPPCPWQESCAAERCAIHKILLCT